MKIFLTVNICLLLFVQTLFSQSVEKQKDASPISYDRQDTLRGSITPERAWWDVTYYHLTLEVDPAKRYIQGSNLVQFTVLDTGQPRLQIDLQPPLRLTQATMAEDTLSFTREGNVYWIEVTEDLKVGETRSLLLSYEGNPHEAINPPWEGGFSWEKSKKQLPYIGTTCQGIGASIWWPCKDHMYDEPDSMRFTYIVPENLVAVGNGRLRSTQTLEGGRKEYDWFVSNPISNYVVSLNIGDYVHFSEVLQGEKGDLDCVYYVLAEHLKPAKRQFKQVAKTIEAFEHWFGPYPFYEDSYKLVEAPFGGMEHQSSIAYDNGFKNGYGRIDYSYSGWGSKFDYIIVHETGHEWFANSITYQDIADMWIHEAFATYSEALFVEYFYGKGASAAYLLGIRRVIRNDKAIIADYGVNQKGSGDIYPKGANILHTLRQIVDNDSLWRATLRGMNRDFYNQIVTTQQIEQYLAEKLGLDLDRFFDQYLRTPHLPLLLYKHKKQWLEVRWTNCVEGFNMPIDMMLKGKKIRIEPETEWKRFHIGRDAGLAKIVEDYYVMELIK